jgi:hypothetical protein
MKSSEAPGINFKHSLTPTNSASSKLRKALNKRDFSFYFGSLSK